MKHGDKILGIVAFMGVMLLGISAQAAENEVSTVDSRELFRSQLVKDNKGQNSNSQQAAKAVDEAVNNLPQLNSRLRWAAVKTPEELVEEKKAAQRQTKAVPIIITAADIDRERKAKKRGEKTDMPALITPPQQPQPQPQPPAITAPKPVQPAPQPQPVRQPEILVPELPADTIELPPIQPIGAAGGQAAADTQEVVELPPVEKIGGMSPAELENAIAEATSIELVIHDIRDAEMVELPAIEPVR